MEKLTSGKAPSEIHETSSLSYYRNEYYKSQQRSIVRTIFVKVVGCASATLNCDVALNLGLAFMLVPQVCIPAT